MTWGEFKAAMAAAGAQDGDEIAWIDVGRTGVEPEDITRRFNGDGVFELQVAV